MIPFKNMWNTLYYEQTYTSVLPSIFGVKNEEKKSFCAKKGEEGRALGFIFHMFEAINLAIFPLIRFAVRYSWSKQYWLILCLISYDWKKKYQ